MNTDKLVKKWEGHLSNLEWCKENTEYHFKDRDEYIKGFISDLKELKEQQEDQLRLYEKTLDITTDQLMGVQAERNELKGLRWIKCSDKPLFLETKDGWECTEDGEGDFIAALSYTEKMKDGTYRPLWWIKHCVIEDGTGLCVVGDDYNELAGWEMKDITHYIKIPPAPSEEAAQNIKP